MICPARLASGLLLAEFGMRWSKAETAVAIASGSLLVLHASSFGTYLADDAAISLAYARNLVHGHGLVLAAGDAPVEGYSNPLWVLLLAIGAAAGGADHPEWLLKGLGLLCAGAALAVSVRLYARAYGPPSPETVWVAPMVIATSTSFAFWSVGGLENPLYACLLALSALLYLGELQSSRRPAGSACALLAVALTRPEGVAFAGVFLAHRLIVRARRTALWAAIFVAGYAVFVLWRHWYFSAWLPNTFYAKIGDRHLGDLVVYALKDGDPGRRYLWQFGSLFPALLAFASAGLMDRTRWRTGLLFAAIVSAQASFILYAGGDWWPGDRFISPVVPILAVLAQRGVELTLRAARLTHGRLAVAAVAAIACAAPNVQALAGFWRTDTDGLISLRSRLARARTVQALAAIAHVPDPTYLEPDIGGPSLAGLRVIDLGMLADVHLARFHYYPPFFRQYIFEERKPDFIRTHSVWSRASRLAAYPELRRDYLAVTEARVEGELSGLFVRKDRFVRTVTEEDAALARWDDIALLSFTPERKEIAAGTPLTFTWEWRCDPACGRDYRLHVRLSSGTTIAGAEFTPVFGWYPTSQWHAGEAIHTTLTWHVPAAVVPGTYEVAVAAVGSGVEAPFVHVGSVSVIPASPAAPESAHALKGPAPPPNRVEAEGLLTRAEDDLRARRFDAAFALLRRARALDPSSARILHRLEDAREGTRWIEYFAARGQLDRLERAYKDAKAHGDLPADPSRLEALYFGLLPIARTDLLAALRRDTRQPGRDTPLAEDPPLAGHAAPGLTLRDYRVARPEFEDASRLFLYFDVQRAPAGDYQIWIHAYPEAQPESRPLTFAIDPATPTSAWKPGPHVESHAFYLPEGNYDIRVGFWQPNGHGRICPHGNTAACYLPLGTYRLGA
jgi:hypothetical protein